MRLTRFALAIAMLSGFGAASVVGVADAANAGAQAGPARDPPHPDRNRSPQVPHERRYVGPGPTVVAPIERIPSVAPLAQPPIR